MCLYSVNNSPTEFSKLMLEQNTRSEDVYIGKGWISDDVAYPTAYVDSIRYFILKAIYIQARKHQNLES